MYIVYDDDNKIIAFHDEKRVVKKYVENYNNTNEYKISFRKVKKSIAKKELKHKEDLYLVKYRSTYVQSRFYDSCVISETDNLEELQQTKDVLYKLLELDYNNLTNKEIKHVYGTLEIIERMILEEKSYTPDINELKQIKENIDRYRNSIY